MHSPTRHSSIRFLSIRNGLPFFSQLTNVHCLNSKGENYGNSHCNKLACFMVSDYDFVRLYAYRGAGAHAPSIFNTAGQSRTALYGYLSRKVSFWLFKIFEIQKGRTFSFNDMLRLFYISSKYCHMKSPLNKEELSVGGSLSIFGIKRCR